MGKCYIKFLDSEVFSQTLKFSNVMLVIINELCIFNLKKGDFVMEFRNDFHFIIVLLLNDSLVLGNTDFFFSYFLKDSVLQMI